MSPNGPADPAALVPPGNASRPVKRSVSFAIFNPADTSLVLIVQRPSDDDDLPDAWGLPAGSLRPGEDWEDAVRRSGREKLGVALEVGAELSRGTLDRAAYTLEMRLLEARILDAEPIVPQPAPGVTQYQAWRWGTADALQPAAAAGSLCSRLFLSR